MTVCDLSDLPVEQCACRVHGPHDAAAPGSFGVPFTARFGGHCQACDEDIHPGDRIVRPDNGRGVYIHEDCQ